MYCKFPSLLVGALTNVTMPLTSAFASELCTSDSFAAA